MLRRGIAFGGLWILLALTPAVILALPSPHWPAALVLLAFLLVSHWYSDKMFLRLVAAHAEAR